MAFINLANVDIIDNTENMHVLVTDGEDVKRAKVESSSGAEVVTLYYKGDGDGTSGIWIDNNYTEVSSDYGRELYEKYKKGEVIIKMENLASDYAGCSDLIGIENQQYWYQFIFYGYSPSSGICKMGVMK